MSNFMGGPGCTPPRRWDHPTHHPDADILDGDWGRYLVKRSAKGSRTFAVYHNGVRTTYSGTREQCRKTVERILEQRDLVEAQGCKPDGYKLALYARMTGGAPAHGTPLSILFQEIAVPLCGKGEPTLRVWHAEDGWHASWGIGGSVGGRAATPEEAILEAHANFIRLRDRNALRERVDAVKRRRK